ncbi:MAG: MMPL family transporter [Magnetospirillum gryphiswaldense]|nr:MMPL family transporter [Magnetospirillum gryphiswaldense]
MKKSLALLWLALVLAAMTHVAWMSRGGLPLDSDLMALLPHEDRDPDVQRAKDRMAETLSRRVVIMVGHTDRGLARAQATRLRDSLSAEGLIRPENDVPSSDVIRRLGGAYFPHRVALLADADRQRLETGNAAALVERALAQVYGFAGAVDSRLLANDPLLLFPAFLTGLPGPASRLTVDDGMLSVADGATTWVMLSVVLTAEPFSLDMQRRFGAIFDDVRAAAADGTRWLRLGALFYAKAGAEQGIAESIRIGGVSLVGTVLLVLLVFRSAQPLLLSLLAIGCGMVTALSSCLALFGSLHVAAQLFGITLIGVAVDYALLYFGQVFCCGIAPAQRLSQVRNGLLLGCGITLFGYAALLLSPFPGLHQVAVFSIVGLAGSMATVMLWFPLLDRTASRPLPPWGRAMASGLLCLWAAPERRNLRRLVLGLLMVLSLFGAFRLQADDDMRRQQGLSPPLVAEQAEVQRLTGFSLTGQFFLVRGDSEQQLLEREEALGQRLSGAVGWQAVARYVPSARRQAENARLVQQTLYGPHLDAYRAGLGMTGGAAPQTAERPLLPADIRATGALPFLDALVIDETLHVVTLDRMADPAIAQGMEGVRFVDPTADLNHLLGTYRLRTLWLIVFCLLAVRPLLAWRYGWRGALRVTLPPALAVTATPLLLALAGIDFSFFAAMGLVLVLSIGTDYAVFYAEERGQDRVALLSVGLAMVTTVLSFGLLAFSDLAGVRAFGATMLVGVILSFLLSPMAGRRDDKKGHS